MFKSIYFKLLLGAMLIVALSAVGSYYWFTNQTVSSSFDDTPNSVNILVLGVDERQDDVGRSDTMFVLTANTETKQLAMLSVPRDTRVKIPGNGWDKINHAYGFGGHKLSKKTAEELLGINIEHYVIINFAGFYKIIDAIGGVDIDVEKGMHYEDPYDNLVIDLMPGMQHLDGKKAIQYVRYRDEEGDIGRVRRQQNFIKAVYDKVFSPSIIPRIPAIISEVMSAVKTDMSASEIASFAKVFSNSYKQGIKTDIVPGKPAYIDEISYWLPDIIALREHVAQIQGIPYDEKYKETAKRLAQTYEQAIPQEMKVIDVPKQVKAEKPPEQRMVKQTQTKENDIKIRVEIVNASGKDDAATKMTEILKARGFEVLSVSTAPPSARTVVVSHTTNSGVINKLTGMPFKYSLQITKNDTYDTTATILIGKDFK